ncbi:MAG: hypothetical protein V1816_01845 [Pseudomonadota bacterium]
MKLNTMAAVMTFVSKLENDSASFYRDNADQFGASRDLVLAWAKENLKFEKQVRQTYFGVITDTLESNYAFEGLDDDHYVLESGPVGPAAGDAARRTEETIINFYLEAARLSDGLMADVPRLFKKIAKKREERLESLA